MMVFSVTTGVGSGCASRQEALHSIVIASIQAAASGVSRAWRQTPGQAIFFFNRILLMIFTGHSSTAYFLRGDLLPFASDAYRAVTLAAIRRQAWSRVVSA